MDLTEILVALNIIATVGGAGFIFGGMRNAIKNVCERQDRQETRVDAHLDNCHQDMGAMGTRVNDVCGRVSTIEGEIKGLSIDKE